jgi:hypothetical protein
MARYYHWLINLTKVQLAYFFPILLVAVVFSLCGCGMFWSSVTMNGSTTFYLNPGLTQNVTISGGSPLSLNVSPTGTGNLLAIGFASGTSDIISSISDSSNTYTPSNVRQSDAGCGCSTDIWYAKNSIGGATTITVTWAGGDPGAIWFTEVSGIDPNNPLDSVAATDVIVPTATVTANSILTSYAHDFILSTVMPQKNIDGIDPTSYFSALAIDLGGRFCYLYGG